MKAYGSLLISLLSLSFSIYLLARFPWYTWPIAWIIGGASVTGVCHFPFLLLLLLFFFFFDYSLFFDFLLLLSFVILK